MEKHLNDMTKDELYVWSLETRIARCIKNINDWKDKFIADPQYMLTWSESTFDFAAELKVCQLVLAYFKDEEENRSFNEKLNEVKIRAFENTVRAAKWPSHSSSQTSNIAEQKLGSVWAKMWEELETQCKYHD